MLLVGVAGRDSAEEIRDRLAELGAVSCDQAARPAWDVSDPAIVVIDGAAGAGRERWAGLHLVIGRAGQPDEEQAVDAWLDPGSPAGPAARETDVLWAGRLVPFEANLRAGRRAPRRRHAVLAAPDPTWAGQARRLIGRLRHSAGRAVTAPVWRETLLFRDWLRSHDEERDAYAAMKRRLADRPGRDVNDYGEDKMPWISSALARAEVWAATGGHDAPWP
jgi:hypothetical protein